MSVYRAQKFSNLPKASLLFDVCSFLFVPHHGLPSYPCCFSVSLVLNPRCHFSSHVLCKGACLIRGQVKLGGFRNYSKPFFLPKFNNLELVWQDFGEHSMCLCISMLLTLCSSFLIIFIRDKTNRERKTKAYLT